MSSNERKTNSPRSSFWSSIYWRPISAKKVTSMFWEHGGPPFQGMSLSLVTFKKRATVFSKLWVQYSLSEHQSPMFHQTALRVHSGAHVFFVFFFPVRLFHPVGTFFLEGTFSMHHVWGRCFLSTLLGFVFWVSFSINVSSVFLFSHFIGLNFVVSPQHMGFHFSFFVLYSHPNDTHYKHPVVGIHFR